MSRFEIEVRVTPREGLLDPEGKAIEHALHSLDFGGATHVRVGRLIRMTLEAGSDAEARRLADDMCRKLLANPVTEDYEVSLKQEAAA